MTTPAKPPALPGKLEYLEEVGTLLDPATGHQTDAPEYPCEIRRRTMELDSAFAAAIVARFNAHEELLAFVEMIQHDRRTPAEHVARAVALLARLDAGGAS
jgi:hypothetical protein